ncbi:DUF1566 domain-containing protein [Paucibacter sp. B2R-40]|uniref:Lcl C-terminal domain-containing protein n=1 Tax=Paucibacter sp. B2R-40 TaxID=2893554 RepID=UPI0021E47F67|nr:DUF1566 domain-containing protein [Paucibacter sp. B2R-40]MCV2353069.1 DUF1566 domain-containing protein [Paucibacter sp. B2R-40]
MKNLNKTLSAAAMLGALALVAAAAQAGPTMLTKLDDKQVLDSSTKLVWVSDWNLAASRGDDADGLMIWADAVAWIAKLNAAKYAGHNDWRLPSTSFAASSPCSGAAGYLYGCKSSEMGHLFYEVLGGKAGETILEQGGDSDVEKANLALFKNVQNDTYWSGTEYTSTFAAWSFNTYFGWQNRSDKLNGFHALAVRTADDATAALPEPQTLGLTLLALAGALLVRRRRAI